MEFIWNSTFEQRPTQNDFGSITGSTIRRIKRAFKERFEVEHTFDTTAAALGTHRVGLCNIIKEASDPPVSLGVRGGFQRAPWKIYFDSGTLPLLVGTSTHEYTQGAIPADHPQYFATNRAVVDFDITVKRFFNLSTDFPIVTSNRILSRDSHLPSDGGIARHANFTPEIGDAPGNMLRNTLNCVQRSVGFSIAAVPAIIELDLPPMSSFPHIFTPGYVGSVYGVAFGPIMDNYNDNRGRICFHIPGTAPTGLYTLNYWEVVP